MNIHPDLEATAQRVIEARHWPQFIMAAYDGFELATRTSRALVDSCPLDDHVRLAEAERAATDGRDILRTAPGRMNANGRLGPPIALPTGEVEKAEASLAGLADALHDRFTVALDEPLGADELVSFSEALDAANRLQRALAREVDDGDIP